MAIFIEYRKFSHFYLSVPLMGKCSDRFGRKPLLLLASVFFLLASYPLYYVISHGNTVALVLSLICFAVFSAVVVGAIIGTLSEFFVTQVRYSGIGLAYNLGFALIGGLTPLVATFLTHKFHDPSALAINLMIGAALMLFVCLPGPISFKDGKGSELA